MAKPPPATGARGGRGLSYELCVLFAGDFRVPVVGHRNYRENFVIADVGVLLDGLPEQLTGGDVAIAVGVDRSVINGKPYA